MRTIRDRGYDRLVPETKLERGLLEAVIRAALDGRETKIHDHPHNGTVKVKDEWDDAGRLAVTLIVPTDDGDDASLSLMLDAMKQYHFSAWVIDRGGEPVVAWEGQSAPLVPGGHAGTQTNHAPYLPHVSPADLVRPTHAARPRGERRLRARCTRKPREERGVGSVVRAGLDHDAAIQPHGQRAERTGHHRSIHDDPVGRQFLVGDRLVAIAAHVLDELDDLAERIGTLPEQHRQLGVMFGRGPLAQEPVTLGLAGRDGLNLLPRLRFSDVARSDHAMLRTTMPGVVVHVFRGHGISAT